MSLRMARLGALLVGAMGCGNSVTVVSAGSEPDAGTGDAAGSGGGPSDAASDGSTPQQLCDTEEQVILHLCTADEISAALGARWWLCSGDNPFTLTDAVGLEFVSDGTWYALRQQPGGDIVRATDFDHQGSWSLVDTSAMNGPCSWQLNVNQAGGGGLPAFPVFSDQPRKLRLSYAMAATDPTYVALP
jgi:hypothetical protein